MSPRSTKFNQHGTLSYCLRQEQQRHWCKIGTPVCQSGGNSFQRIVAHNEDAIARYNGEIHPKALAKMIEPLPTKMKPPSAAWCQWFRVAWGWGMYCRSSDAQAWLPFDHPDMVASRNAVQSLIAEGTHPGMILNYDQIWRNNFNTAKFKVPFRKKNSPCSSKYPLRQEESRRQGITPQFDSNLTGRVLSC